MTAPSRPELDRRTVLQGAAAAGAAVAVAGALAACSTDNW